MTGRRGVTGPGEDGSAFAMTAMGLAVCAAALVLVIDLAAYLVAAARAQTAADAAALAAVAVADPRGGTTGSPIAAARRVAEANGATLRRCSCPLGARRVEVVARMPVHAIALTRVAARAVDATASARLTGPPPSPDPAALRRMPR